MRELLKHYYIIFLREHLFLTVLLSQFIRAAVHGKGDQSAKTITQGLWLRLFTQTAYFEGTFYLDECEHQRRLNF